MALGSAEIVRPPGLPILDFFSRTFSRLFLDEEFGTSYWRTVVVPWAPEERVDRLREMKDARGLGPLFGNNTGTVPRTNGSPFYGSKVTESAHLCGFIVTLTRQPLTACEGQRMSRAMLLLLCRRSELMEFGPHRMLTTDQRRVTYRYADEVLFAIGQYLLSLEPKNGMPRISRSWMQGIRFLPSRDVPDATRRRITRTGC